jgi:hypothetical protein
MFGSNVMVKGSAPTNLIKPELTANPYAEINSNYTSNPKDLSPFSNP